MPRIIESTIMKGMFYLALITIFLGTALTSGSWCADAVAPLQEKPKTQIQHNQVNSATKSSDSERAALESAAAKPANEKKKKLKFKKKGGLVYTKGKSNGGDYELKCDLYIPEGEGPFPAIVAVHGGSWTSGSKLHMLRHAWKMAARGYVVMAINYRHAPRHKFPAQLHDCKAAVRWLRHHAESCKVDPTRIGGYGYSAGGHLIGLLATTDSEDGFEGEVPDVLKEYSTRLQAVSIGGAPCEFSWVGSSTLKFFLGKSRNSAPDLYERASPITYVDSKDPPFYIFHGSKDAIVPVSSTEKMQKRLQDAGIHAVRKVVDGKGHFATFSDFGYLEETLDFFDQVLAKTSDSAQD